MLIKKSTALSGLLLQWLLASSSGQTQQADTPFVRFFSHHCKMAHCERLNLMFFCSKHAEQCTSWHQLMVFFAANKLRLHKRWTD
jgi:hypothetical protein